MGRQAAVPEALSALAQAVRRNSEPWVRVEAARALGELGPQAATPESVAALARALRDRSSRVREEAIRALGRMGPQAATPEALAALARIRQGVEARMAGREPDWRNRAVYEAVRTALDALEAGGETKP